MPLREERLPYDLYAWDEKPPNVLFSVKPETLRFPVDMESISCSFQLSDKSDKHVAFRVKTTNPFKFSVQPKNGIVLPRSQINVTVTVQAQEIFSNVGSGDEFLVQCVAVPPGTTLEEITPEMFNKEAVNHVEECKLNVTCTYGYVDPVEETSEDDTADSGGSSDHEITSTKKLLKLFKWGPRRYNGGGGMSIHYVLLIAVLAFLLGYCV